MSAKQITKLKLNNTIVQVSQRLGNKALSKDIGLVIYQKQDELLRFKP